MWKTKIINQELEMDRKNVNKVKRSQRDMEYAMEISAVNLWFLMSEPVFLFGTDY